MENQNLLNNTIAVGILLTVAVVGVVVYFNRKKKYKNIDDIPDFSTDEQDYEEANYLIDTFIKKRNWLVLEEMLDSLTAKRFPDLKQKIEEALKNK